MIGMKQRLGLGLGVVCMLATAFAGNAQTTQVVPVAPKTQTAVKTEAQTGNQWIPNFRMAKKAAAKEGRPIMMFFTGSDWCGYCIQFDKEILKEKAFQDYAQEHLVLLKLDFPKKIKQDEAQKRHNSLLATAYHVGGFPTVVLTDAEGRQIARLGYQRGGAASFVAALQKALKSYHPEKQSVSAKDSSPVVPAKK